MDSDESPHSESAFYYPEEIDNNQNEQKSINMNRNAVESGENFDSIADIHNYIIA